MEKKIVNGKEYHLIKLLGKGKGGYSYLGICDGEQYVVKQIHHEHCDYYTFGDKMEAEKSDYEKLSNLNINIPKMFEWDKETECIIKEYIDGPTVFDLVLKDQVDEKYFQQIFKICNILLEADLNIDYFPTNFVIQDDKLYYIDYECNKYMKEWNFENWGINYWLYSKSLADYLKEKDLSINFKKVLSDIDLECIKRNYILKYKIKKNF